MPLGIEQNSIAPQLIQNSGQALVQGIRQIGQQVSSHLTEIQTRRDLGALAQEFQGLNVQSNEFPTQFAELITRHPLAARDERAQMALSALQKAHGQWQAGQNAMARMDVPVNIPGVGLVNRKDGTVIRAAPQRPIAVGPQSRLVDPSGKTLVEPLPVQEKPFTLSPGGVRYDAQGNKIADNPKPAATATPYQTFQMERTKRRERRDNLKLELDQINKQIAAFEKTFHETYDREKNASKEQVPTIITERSQLGTQLQALGEIRDAKVKEIAGIEREDAPSLFDPGEEIPPLPDESYPPATPQATAPVTSVVIRRDPKSGKRYEVDINTKQVIREVP